MEIAGDHTSIMCALSVFVALLLVGTSHCLMVEWEAQDYPNPMFDMEKCGRHIGRRSYVCDPNGIISVKDADALDNILLGLPNMTSCPCSAWSCERPGKDKGFHIFVALVKKLKRKEGTPKSREASEGLAGKFALTLLNKNWKIGECNEEVVILYSKEDGILRTQTGSTARLLLKDEIAAEIQRAMARFFQNEDTVGQGLQYLAMNYRRVLDGQDHLPIMYTNVDAGAAVVKISLLTSLITTLLFKLLC